MPIELVHALDDACLMTMRLMNSQGMTEGDAMRASAQECGVDIKALEMERRKRVSSKGGMTGTHRHYTGGDMS